MSKTDIAKFEDKLDKVVKYYFDDRKQVKLSEDLLKQIERWKFIRMVYTSWRTSSRRDIVSAVVKEYGVDEATAYRDILNAQKLYVRLEEVNKEFERIIRIEDIKALRAKCIAKGDLKTAAACDANLIKIGGYDKELEAPKVINNIINQLMYDPTLVGAEKIPNIEQVVKSFLAKKKRVDDSEIEDANVIEDQLKNAATG